MKNCDVAINIPASNQSSYIIGQIDPESDEWRNNSKLGITVKLLLNATQSLFDKINAAIANALIGGSGTTAYDKHSIYVPNYSPLEFISEFGALFGLSVDLDIIHDILLIDKDLPLDDDNMLLKRVLRSDPTTVDNPLPMYVLSRTELPRFAAHLRALLNIKTLSMLYDKKLLKESLTDEELLYEPYILQLLKLYKASEKWLSKDSKEDRKNKLISSLKNTLIKNLDAKLNSLTRNDKFGLLRNLKIKTDELQTAQENNSSLKSEKLDAVEAQEEKIRRVLNYLVTGTKILYSQDLQYNDEGKILSRLKELLTDSRLSSEIREEYNLHLRNLNLKLRELESFSDKSIIEKVKILQDGFDVKDGYNTPKDLLLTVLTNQKLANKVFAGNLDLYYELVDFLYTISGRTSKINNKNKIVNSINVLISKHQNKIPISEIKKYFSSKANIGSNIDVETQWLDLLSNGFIKLQYDYKSFYIKGNHISFVKRQVSDLQKTLYPNAEIFLTQSNTIRALLPNVVMVNDNYELEQYRGFYIYNVIIDNKSKWFYSKFPTYSYSLREELFDTKEEVINTINNNFNSVNLSEEPSLLLDTIISQRDRNIYTIKLISPFDYYHQGQIIEIPDVEYGDLDLNVIKSYPGTFIIELYNNWLSNTFRTKELQYILQNITTPSQMALFYKLVRNYITNKTDNELYRYKWETISQLVDRIANAKTKHYVVTQSTHSVYNDKYFEIREFDFTKKVKTKTKISNSSKINIPIVDWTIMKSVFANNGILMQLVTDDEMRRLTGANESEHIKGLNHNGIIYINTQYATWDTPFHEYSHILLGILKLINPQHCLELLDRYLLVNESNQTWSEKYKNKRNSYRLLYESLNQNISDDLLKYIALEEMFADDYGLYLCLHSTNMYDLFHDFSNSVLLSSIFDKNITEIHLFLNANSKFEIFGILSSQIFQAKTRRLYGFTLTDDNINKVSSAAKQSTKELFETLDLENNGLYSLCD